MQKEKTKVIVVLQGVYAGLFLGLFNSLYAKLNCICIFILNMQISEWYPSLCNKKNKCISQNCHYYFFKLSHNVYATHQFIQKSSPPIPLPASKRSPTTYETGPGVRVRGPRGALFYQQLLSSSKRHAALLCNS